MSRKMNMNIQIPTDDDGYIALECPGCLEKFMLTADDIERKEQIDIWCPCCGLIYENYLTNQIIEIANRMVENQLSDILNNFGKSVEKQLKSDSMIDFKLNKKMKKGKVLPIIPEYRDLDEMKYNCCHKKAKISFVLKIIGGYCPFCGEILDGNN